MCAAIAAALVKLAFFPDTAQAQPAAPGGELTVDGTIARDDAVTVRSEIEGTITGVAVAEGQTVAAGQVLFTVTQTYPVKSIDVTAPEAGDLTSFEVVKGQPVSLGGEVAKLSPDRYLVVGTVDPVLLYRLVGAPTEAQITIQGGAGTGVVWLEADGALVERTIALGVTDGALVQVTECLEEGDAIRQFVPGMTAEPVCYPDRMGGEFCEDPGMSW